MEVLICSTYGPSLRSEIWGWDHEDAKLYVGNKPIGYTPGPRHAVAPDTILQALSEGWRLLAPPRQEAENDYIWWLTRE